MNEASISRLEQAGVSVPALGIGQRDSDQSVPAQSQVNNQVNELQSRFAKTSTPGSQNLQNAGSPDKRPSNGVNNYNNINSSTTSGTEIRSRAPLSTSNLRQRGSEHIEAGKQKLVAFNQKHRITERISSYFEEPAQTSPQQGGGVPPPPPPHPNLTRQTSNIDMDVLNRRKPPPPPPPAKKPSLQSTPVNNNSGSPPPPPLPLGTKPR